MAADRSTYGLMCNCRSLGDNKKHGWIVYSFHLFFPKRRFGTSHQRHEFVTVYMYIIINLFPGQRIMGWTILKVVLLFWSHFTIVFADYVCVCSNHIGAKIYPSADTHTMPIGTLYPDIGECKPAYNDTSHPHFVALVHFHQVPRRTLLR